jgi:type VI secretion system protein ImpM
VSQAVAGAAATGWRQGAAIGFCGKIPARGDFIRTGLPRAFTEPWDHWMERMIAASRAALGEAWLAAWLEAPVWRFALPPGVCGPDSVIGLWMPSVDSIGRYYPLTIAAVTDDADHCTLMQKASGFLEAAERAGREALENRLAPEQLAGRLNGAAGAPPDEQSIGLVPSPEGASWWTQGGPRVSAMALASGGLPDENSFIAMMEPCTSMLPAARQA